MEKIRFSRRKAVKWWAIFTIEFLIMAAGFLYIANQFQLGRQNASLNAAVTVSSDR